ncbi:ABC transporter permease, partial [Pyxidicoccus fallax]
LPAPPLEVRVRTLFNPNGRSALFLVPGLAAYLLAIVAVLITALTVAREWERGSMEQLFATPVGRLEIVVGKLLPYLGIGLLQVLLVLTVGAWLFDVPVRGSLVALGLGALLFLVGMLGQGLLISVITRNQVVATQVATMSSMLPSMLLSGFIFPIENLPPPLRVISLLIPARHFVTTLRGVLLRGNGLDVLWPQLVALTLFAALMLTLATRRFQRRLD